MDNNTAVVLIVAVFAFMVVGIAWAGAFAGRRDSKPSARSGFTPEAPYTWSKTTRTPVEKPKDDNADWKKPNRG